MSQLEEWNQQVQDIQDILAKLQRSVVADQARMAALEQLVRDILPILEDCRGDIAMEWGCETQIVGQIEEIQQRAKKLLNDHE